ncbi:hypothetical protein ACH0BF_02260 [Pseudobacillus sp. 179-B 2D1 NHS]|uniref:hypothetical protein n=1 Tax=Pseudobacillus sp. 179-B 2D1 NHS TaxID=3374292 RepID=UPI003879FD5A
MTTNGAVYIPSMEASQIMEHMVRGNFIKREYIGMIPYSLELIKLKETGLKVIPSKRQPNKQISDDIINVKFDSKVKSGEKILELIPNIEEKIKIELAALKEKLEGLKKQFEEEPKQKKLVKEIEKVEKIIQKKQTSKDKLEALKSEIESNEGSDKWNEMTASELRKHLYENGFVIKQTDKETGKVVKTTTYEVYKRSSAKSRTGQCLFIRKQLKNKMIKWSRMNLSFKKNQDIDLASLLAYESLVGSSLEKTIKIDADKILIVDDVESVFTETCNVVRKNKDTGFLDSFEEPVKVSNSLFDGESLLDAKYFEDGQSMKLLRNHMFKSASFSTHIQKFLKKHCPKGKNYDEWEIENMYGETIAAKDIELIITPSSLKALKFADVFVENNGLKKDKEVWENFWKEHKNKYEKQMFNHWKELVKSEGNIFGVVKHEKESKRGTDFEGNIVNQTSYQMVNSMPMERKDIEKLTTFEKEYIEKLKNDDDFFVEYLEKSASNMDSNMMLVDLYKINKEIARTKLFRDFRKAEINRYKTNIQRGKIRLRGDYAVLFGNPVEFLYHAIGKFDVNKPKLALTGNQIHTSMFNEGDKVTCMRNPHTSPSNVLIGEVVKNDMINTYFNLTKNIVCVNSVKFNIQSILSGCDFDSDSVVLFKDERLQKIAEQCYGKYLVCNNAVEPKKLPYKLNNTDMCKIDNSLSNSQSYIGRVVNLGQEIMSVYWDELKQKEHKNDLDILLKKVSVATILSEIAIDMAKKFFDIDMNKEISHIEKSFISKTKEIEIEKEIKDKKGEVVKKEKVKEIIDAKPLFFKYVSQNNNIKNSITPYNCPMDYLYKEMENLPYADQKENIEVERLLNKENLKNTNSSQIDSINGLVGEMEKEIKKVYADYKGKKKDEERNQKIIDVMSFYNEKVSKKKVKPDTMFATLNKHQQLRLWNSLYKNHKETFLNAFKKQ